MKPVVRKVIVNRRVPKEEVGKDGSRTSYDLQFVLSSEFGNGTIKVKEEGVDSRDNAALVVDIIVEGEDEVERENREDSVGFLRKPKPKS